MDCCFADWCLMGISRIQWRYVGVFFSLFFFKYSNFKVMVLWLLLIGVIH